MPNTTFQVQYVFWDSDNTLVNTAEHHWRKHVETLKTLGITLDEEYRQRVYENNGVQNWTWMKKDIGLEMSQEDYLTAIDQWYFDHIDEIDIRSGVLEALKDFKKNKIPQAVVSNGRRRSVIAALKAKRLLRFFDFVLCNEDYEGRKPDPAPYLTALSTMQERTKTTIEPASCLVIEDDPLGVKAGEAAGMVVLHRPMGDKTPFGLLLS
jgi:HAD superfamily hydrolase (TIGR01509 family)